MAKRKTQGAAPAAPAVTQAPAAPAVVVEVTAAPAVQVNTSEVVQTATDATASTVVEVKKDEPAAAASELTGSKDDESADEADKSLESKDDEPSAAASEFPGPGLYRVTNNTRSAAAFPVLDAQIAAYGSAVVEVRDESQYKRFCTDAKSICELNGWPGGFTIEPANE